MFDLAPESGWDRRRSTLLERYEMVALDLFAERGYRDVTFEDVAAAAGVSSRTLFRYFPTKEDFLLGLPRRGAAVLVGRIAALPPGPEPLLVIWETIRDHTLADQPHVRLLDLWRRAAADAPEIHHRVIGERVRAVAEAVMAYCSRCLGADPGLESRIRLLAGAVSGVELAAMEAWGRSPADLTQILAEADAVVSRILDGA